MELPNLRAETRQFLALDISLVLEEKIKKGGSFMCHKSHCRSTALRRQEKPKGDTAT